MRNCPARKVGQGSQRWRNSKKSSTKMAENWEAEQAAAAFSLELPQQLVPHTLDWTVAVLEHWSRKDVAMCRRESSTLRSSPLQMLLEPNSPNEPKFTCQAPLGVCSRTRLEPSDMYQNSLLFDIRDWNIHILFLLFLPKRNSLQVSKCLWKITHQHGSPSFWSPRRQPPYWQLLGIRTSFALATGPRRC